jgi:hypothetical protein
LIKYELLNEMLDELLDELFDGVFDGVLDGLRCRLCRRNRRRFGSSNGSYRNLFDINRELNKVSLSLSSTENHAGRMAQVVFAYAFANASSSWRDFHHLTPNNIGVKVSDN